jgi:superfamily II DNA or RNA helicase
MILNFDFPKINNSYLGNHGYTIFKNNLNEQQQNHLKKLLTAKPLINKLNTLKITYPVYRESDIKFYIPRYFGIKHFGSFHKVKLNEGENIHLTFNGELRNIQKSVVESFMSNVSKQETSGFGGGGLIELQTGEGKTVISLNIISIVNKKTLIIVHKEFLANQWLERINEFLPNAKVGRIQSSILDIENKDIVIGMLQSISMKDYPVNTFSSFGLLIIDEVHHISSEVFSQALFKIVTKYTLGLSATMERKDGTTQIFKYFLGDIIYKNKEKEEHNVEIRKINYISDNDEFNNVVTDYKGNVQYSTMIVKLCKFNPRSEFILRIIKDLLKEDATQHIMLLAHNRNLIDYLFESITYNNICSVGKYIGGMKPEQLKESETKKVIVATYAMASEGLDIKTLTTLILATPKTDVVQSVGRILRTKENKKIVVDIVDSQNIFQNQYKKRQTFYKKNNYSIISCTNKNYTSNNTLAWETLFDPLKKNEKIVVKEKKQENNDHLFQKQCFIPSIKKNKIET